MLQELKEISKPNYFFLKKMFHIIAETIITAITIKTMFLYSSTRMYTLLK